MFQLRAIDSGAQFQGLWVNVGAYPREALFASPLIFIGLNNCSVFLMTGNRRYPSGDSIYVLDKFSVSTNWHGKKGCEWCCPAPFNLTDVGLNYLVKAGDFLKESEGSWINHGSTGSMGPCCMFDISMCMTDYARLCHRCVIGLITKSSKISTRVLHQQKINEALVASHVRVVSVVGVYTVYSMWGQNVQIVLPAR